MTRSAGLAALPAGMSPALAVAAETLPQVSLFGSLLQALLGLLVVLALLYGFFWIMRRFGPTQTAAQGVVKVVGGVMLGPRERLVVVEVQDTWLLVGVAAGHVSTLHTLPKPAGVAAQVALQANARAPMASFADRLADLLRRPKT